MNNRNNYGKAKQILLLVLFWSISMASFAQQERTISGKVKDATNFGVPGVTVVKKGTTTGTTTAADGQYSIKASTGDVLEFSFIGYDSQSIALVAGEDNYDITLQLKNELLDNIVVVGYGVQKKSDLSSAVSTVSADDANKIAAASPAQMIQGRTAGVSVINGGSPGSAPYIKIRGMSSFGDVQPLYVIDGIPGGDISTVNPDDIESFEILKDGAAAAIYGSLAANGVILVQTKSGKKNQPAKVDFSMYAGLQQSTGKLPMANASEWYSIMKQAYDNSVADGTFREEDKPGYLQKNTQFKLSNYADTDWQDEVLQVGAIQNYSLGIRGGGASSNYNLSANYFQQEGVIRNSGTERFNFRFKSMFEKGRLKVMPNVMYTQTITNNSTVNIANMQKSNPLVSVYDESKESGYGYLNEYGIRSGANAVGQSEIINSKLTSDNLQANLGMNFKLNSDLFLAGNVGYNRVFYKQRGDHPAYVLASDTRRDDPYLSEYRADWTTLNYDLTINYMKTLGKSNFTAMAGIVGYQYDYQNIEAEVTGGAMLPDFGGLVPSFDGMTSGDFTGNGSFAAIRRFSYMARLNYSYDNRYLLQATVRTDGSSKFNQNNRWGAFPSVSAAWKIHQEPFFERARSLFSELKLRASYGILGRETSLGAYARQALVGSGYWYSQNNVPVGGNASFQLANSELTWEKSKTLNIGLDFGLFDQQVYGSFNYYQNNSEALLLEEPNTPPSSGLDAPTVNLGSISNQGVELELGHRGEFGKFHYDISGNLTTIKNKVNSLGNRSGTLPGDDILYAGSFTFSEVGASASQFYTFKTNGLFQSQQQVDGYTNSKGQVIQPNAKAGDVIYVDINDDGMIDSNDITNTGSPLPTIEYGLNLNLSYSNFDMSLFFQGVGGNKILNVNRYELEAPTSGYNLLSGLTNAWSETNKNTDTPRNVITDTNNNYQMSDRFLENGSYFRLKNIQLGYSLPKQLLGKWNIEKLRLYVNADNLFTFTKYSGYDPELIPANALTQGVDYGNYPMYQTFTAGLQLTF